MLPGIMTLPQDHYHNRRRTPGLPARAPLDGRVRGRLHAAAPVRGGLGDDLPRGPGRARLAEHVRDQYVPLRLLECPLRRARRAYASSLRGRGGHGHDGAHRLVPGLRAAPVHEGAGRRRAPGGDRPGNSGWNARDPGVHVSGRGARLHRAGILRPDGRASACSRAKTGKPRASPQPDVGTAQAARPGHARARLRSDRAGGLVQALRHPLAAGPARRVAHLSSFFWPSCSATGCGEIGRRFPGSFPRRSAWLWR